jgi:hypothetical protein
MRKIGQGSCPKDRNTESYSILQDFLKLIESKGLQAYSVRFYNGVKA